LNKKTIDRGYRIYTKESAKKSRKIQKSSNRWRWRFGSRLSIFLSNVASEVTLIRRNEFRGALDSVEKSRN
jgi:hypothetical protein